MRERREQPHLADSRQPAQNESEHISAVVVELGEVLDDGRVVIEVLHEQNCVRRPLDLADADSFAFHCETQHGMPGMLVLRRLRSELVGIGRRMPPTPQRSGSRVGRLRSSAGALRSIANQLELIASESR